MINENTKQFKERKVYWQILNIIDKKNHKFLVILPDFRVLFYLGKNTQLFWYSWCPLWAQDAHLLPISLEYVNQLRQPLSLARISKTKQKSGISTIIIIIPAMCVESLVCYCGYSSCVCVCVWLGISSSLSIMCLIFRLLRCCFLCSFLLPHSIYIGQAKGNVGHKKQFILE